MTSLPSGAITPFILIPRSTPIGGLPTRWVSITRHRAPRPGAAWKIVPKVVLTEDHLVAVAWLAAARSSQGGVGGTHENAKHLGY